MVSVCMKLVGILCEPVLDYVVEEPVWRQYRRPVQWERSTSIPDNPMTAEQTLGVPVLTSNQCLIWESLHVAAGSEGTALQRSEVEAVRGYGQLFSLERPDDEAFHCAASQSTVERPSAVFGV